MPESKHEARGKGLALAAARAAEDKKASAVTVLGLENLSPLCDFFVIASGTNRLQVRAIATAVEEKLEEVGGRLDHREGNDQAGWVLLDFGDVVVHIFIEELRQFYDLERLWEDAERILDPN